MLTRRLTRPTNEDSNDSDFVSLSANDVSTSFTFSQQLVGRKLISCSVCAVVARLFYVLLALGMLHATWCSNRNVLLIEIEIKFVTNCFQVKYAKPNAIWRRSCCIALTAQATHTSCCHECVRVCVRVADCVCVWHVATALQLPEWFLVACRWRVGCKCCNCCSWQRRRLTRLEYCVCVAQCVCRSVYASVWLVSFSCHPPPVPLACERCIDFMGSHNFIIFICCNK